MPRRIGIGLIYSRDAEDAFALVFFDDGLVWFGSFYSYPENLDGLPRTSYAELYS
jgi:hypothetical protein